MTEKSSLRALFDTFPQTGCVEWIGLRPAREAAMHEVTRVHATPGDGLEGNIAIGDQVTSVVT